MDRYCVFGNPIAHSKSPWIHTEFSRQTRQAMHYEARLAPIDNFAAALADFWDAGGKGCNVTVPFKEEAWQLADRRSQRAEKAGAVNTLRKEPDGSVFGDNTDGIGLVRDLTVNAGFSLGQKRILVLGAGGAVRGILEPLLAEKPTSIVIANRTQAKAEALSELFRNEGTITAISIDALKNHTFDLVINGTSASLQGETLALPPQMLSPHSLAYDMMYGAAPTPFLAWAAAAGAQTRDGSGMLIEQAAEAFFLWRSVRPQTEPVLAALRVQLGGPKS